jgi:methionyl-tRNA formyltransferase
VSAGSGDRTGAAPARVVFFGSGRFAIPVLRALLDAPDIRVVGVVTAPDRPAGRGKAVSATPVAAAARAAGLALLQPIRLREPAAHEAVAALVPDLGVLADYGRIVPPDILAIPSSGFLNIHPSLLPRHRGASPIPAAILAGDARSGVTIMSMDAGLDTGPIVAVEPVGLSGHETAADLELELAAAGAALLLRTLPGWLSGALPAVPQGDAGVTVTRPLRREDGRLDGAEPADDAARRVRALDPWPGTFVELEPDGSRLGVVSAAAAVAHDGDRPGMLVPDGAGVALTTTTGRLRLLRVRPAGGTTMDAAAWRHGHPLPADGRRVRGGLTEVTP